MDSRPVTRAKSGSDLAALATEDSTSALKNHAAETMHRSEIKETSRQATWTQREAVLLACTALLLGLSIGQTALCPAVNMDPIMAELKAVREELKAVREELSFVQEQIKSTSPDLGPHAAVRKDADHSAPNTATQDTEPAVPVKEIPPPRVLIVSPSTTRALKELDLSLLAPPGAKVSAAEFITHERMRLLVNGTRITESFVNGKDNICAEIRMNDHALITAFVTESGFNRSPLAELAYATPCQWDPNFDAKLVFVGADCKTLSYIMRNSVTKVTEEACRASPESKAVLFREFIDLSSNAIPANYERIDYDALMGRSP